MKHFLLNGKSSKNSALQNDWHPSMKKYATSMQFFYISTISTFYTALYKNTIRKQQKKWLKDYDRFLNVIYVTVTFLTFYRKELLQKCIYTNY